MEPKILILLDNNDFDKHLENTVKSSVIEVLNVIASMCENAHPDDLPFLGGKIRKYAETLEVKTDK